MKRIHTLGALLWRATTHPLTLPILVAGCAALLAWRTAGLLATTGDGAASYLERLAAAWLLLTAICGLCRAIGESCPGWRGAALRAGRARRIAAPPYPAPAQSWAAYCARLVGMPSGLLRPDAPQGLLTVRSLGQRLGRSSLYWGLALLTAWGGLAWLADRPAVTALLLLGQHAPLADTAAMLKLDEVTVVRDDAGELRVLEALVTVQWQGETRQIVLRRGRGVVAARYDLRLGTSREAANVYVAQAGGHAVTVYPIDGARPEGDRARVSFTALQQEQLVAAPQAGLLVRLVYYSDDQAGNASGLSAELLDGESGAVLAQAGVSGATTLVARGYTVVITPEVAVLVQAQPLGARLAGLIAAILIILGSMAHALWPGRCAWFAFAPDGALWLLEMQAAPWDRRWTARLMALLTLPDELA